jgi:hypothetical protein
MVIASQSRSVPTLTNAVKLDSGGAGMGPDGEISGVEELEGVSGISGVGSGPRVESKEEELESEETSGTAVGASGSTWVVDSLSVVVKVSLIMLLSLGSVVVVDSSASVVGVGS